MPAATRANSKKLKITRVRHKRHMERSPFTGGSTGRLPPSFATCRSSSSVHGVWAAPPHACRHAAVLASSSAAILGSWAPASNSSSISPIGYSAKTSSTSRCTARGAAASGAAALTSSSTSLPARPSSASPARPPVRRHWEDGEATWGCCATGDGGICEATAGESVAMPRGRGDAVPASEPGDRLRVTPEGEGGKAELSLEAEPRDGAEAAVGEISGPMSSTSSTTMATAPSGGPLSSGAPRRGVPWCGCRC
mmetsp:Transcript_131101/g.280397  ORF Transcript_131101/g.280397 Transcript_131101/m.280397 type:complete len:252 (+) Transcript_131101:137-892(+)